MKQITPKAIIIHHGGNNNSFYTTNSYHRKKWNFKSELGWYIGYQWFIDNSGKLFQGRKETEEGAHKKGWNDKSIGICLRGNLEKRKPTKQQLATLRKLLQDCQKCWDIPKSEIYAHKELSATLCPGKNLMPFIRDYRHYIPETTPSTTQTPKVAQEPSEGVKTPSKEQLQTQLNKIKSILLALKQKIHDFLTG